MKETFFLFFSLLLLYYICCVLDDITCGIAVNSTHAELNRDIQEKWKTKTTTDRISLLLFSLFMYYFFFIIIFNFYECLFGLVVAPSFTVQLQSVIVFILVFYSHLNISRILLDSEGFSYICFYLYVCFCSFFFSSICMCFFLYLCIWFV